MSKAAAKRALTQGKEFYFRWKGRAGQPGWVNAQYRKVVHVQTNAVAMAKDRESEAAATQNPHRLATWLYFDQKDGARWEVGKDGEITITHTDGYVMQYVPIPAEYQA